MPSLRNKILSAYGYSKVVMLAFALVVFFDLYYLNRQIEKGQVVTDFREVTLEMRRIEKNLFLYRDTASYEQLMAHVGTAEKTFAKGQASFRTIIGDAGLRRITSLLQRYRATLDRYATLTPPSQANARLAIRDLGHALTEVTSELSRGERRLLAQATQRAAILLLSAFVIVVLLGLAGGLFLVRRVVRPLRELEAGLRAIDMGQARVLPMPSKDQEIKSFVASFNAMLKHMRQQQDQARRNEKAAALGVLVSGVAHELNNPLSNISTSAQLMLEFVTDCAKRVRQRDPLPSRRALPALLTGEIQQLLDQSCRAVDGRGDAGERFSPDLVVRGHCRDLRVRPQACQRRLQLMRGARDEMAFASAQLFELGELTIDRVDQRVELARRATCIDWAERCRIALCKLAGHMAQGLQTRPDRRPNQRCERSKADQRRHQQAEQHIADQALPNTDVVPHGHANAALRAGNRVNAPALAGNVALGETGSAFCQRLVRSAARTAEQPAVEGPDLARQLAAEAGRPDGDRLLPGTKPVGAVLDKRSDHSGGLDKPTIEHTLDLASGMHRDPDCRRRPDQDGHRCDQDEQTHSQRRHPRVTL